MEIIYNELVRSIEKERCKCGLDSIVVGIEYLPYLEKKKENLFLIRAYICDVKERKTFIRVVQTPFTEELILRLFSYNDEILSSLMCSIRLRLQQPISTSSWNLMNDIIESIFQTGCVTEIRELIFTSDKERPLESDLKVIEISPDEYKSKMILGCIIRTPTQEYYDRLILPSPINPNKIQDDLYLFSEVLKHEYNRRWKEKQLWDFKKYFKPVKE